ERVSFTGVVHARTESNLGFRVAGKIVERLVDPGQTVRRGQPLRRIDAVDYDLALAAARSAVEAAQARQVQAVAEEARLRKLL
ncbi:biotin/lipoyl-binding protein, partial [Acinetobacter baumannii]